MLAKSENGKASKMAEGCAQVGEYVTAYLSDQTRPPSSHKRKKRDYLTWGGIRLEKRKSLGKLPFESEKLSRPKGRGGEAGKKGMLIKSVAVLGHGLNSPVLEGKEKTSARAGERAVAGKRGKRSGESI